MLVRCKKYSTLYPDGVHRVGDIVSLPKKQARYFEQLGWVEILPRELQKRKVKPAPVIDYSKSRLDGRKPVYEFLLRG